MQLDLLTSHPGRQEAEGRQMLVESDRNPRSSPLPPMRLYFRKVPQGPNSKTGCQVSNTQPIVGIHTQTAATVKPMFFFAPKEY